MKTEEQSGDNEQNRSCVMLLKIVVIEVSIFPVLVRSSNSIIPKHMFRSLIGAHFSSSENLPGAIPVQVVSLLKKDTPSNLLLIYLLLNIRINWMGKVRLLQDHDLVPSKWLTFLLQLFIWYRFLRPV